MALSLTGKRVLRDVDVIARAGLDLETFLTEANESISRAIPHTAACMATLDPSTNLLTSTHKFGRLRGVDDHDHEWGLVEFGTQEPSSFDVLSTAEEPAMATRAQSPDSVRLNEFMVPTFDFGDELRFVLRERGAAWGGVAMFRDQGQEPFSVEDVELVCAISGVMARGIRSGILTVATQAALTTAGPAVVLVDENDQIAMVSSGAETRLAELMTAPDGVSSAGIVAALVGAARRYAAGQITRPPRCRVRGGNGAWLSLYATTMQGRDGARGNVVVTIDEASPPEIVPLVVAAFELTDRERDVVQYVIQGLDTKEIAATMHVSSYTVQDHLKSIFSKADVRSRRELIARIYFDQYVPRLGTELGADGWFANA